MITVGSMRAFFSLMSTQIVKKATLRIAFRLPRSIPALYFYLTLFFQGSIRL